MQRLRVFLYAFAAGASLFFVVNETFLAHVPPDFDQILETDEPYYNPWSEEAGFTRPPGAQPEEVCRLPQLDPWDPSFERYLDPARNPKKNCKPSFQVRSRLKNGLLTVEPQNLTVDEKEECFYRCLTPVDDYDMVFENWTAITAEDEARPACDVVEVKCEVGLRNTYKYLHQQIYEVRRDANVTAPASAADVHLIIVDSVSMSQFVRSMPMTAHFLRTQLEAHFFGHLNKVGLNSRPNAYAFLLGERGYDLPASPWGPAVRGGVGNRLCRKPLDDENFVGFDFARRGYRSLLNEDWAAGVFNWPNCVGFKRPPADHYMKPFALRVDGRRKHKDPILAAHVYKDTCHESHDYMLDLIEEFAQKYPGEPKFSMSWITNVAHDDMNGLYHIDAQVKATLNRIKDKLQNSFLIFMADHGGRTGHVRKTPVGEIEDHNPFFIISVPQRLRENRDLVLQLADNSKQLVTHYDLYATFLELAVIVGWTKCGRCRRDQVSGFEASHGWTNATKFSTSAFRPTDRRLKGSSLLHALRQPRHCSALLVPFDYCLCERARREVARPALAAAAGARFVRAMNRAVRESAFAARCAPLRLDPAHAHRVERFDQPAAPNRTVYLVQVRVLPSGGLYSGYVVEEEGALHVISTEFPRLDMYKEQTKCMPQHFIRNYCYCKDLLEPRKVEKSNNSTLLKKKRLA